MNAIDWIVWIVCTVVVNGMTQDHYHKMISRLFLSNYWFIASHLFPPMFWLASLLGKNFVWLSNEAILSLTFLVKYKTNNHFVLFQWSAFKILSLPQQNTAYYSAVSAVLTVFFLQLLPLPTEWFDAIEIMTGMRSYKRLQMMHSAVSTLERQSNSNPSTTTCCSTLFLL